MQGGTLTNEYPDRPKALFVFEGLIAVCESVRLERQMQRWGRYGRAMGLWKQNPLMIAYLRRFEDLYERHFDVITWQPAGFVPHLDAWLDDRGVHPQRVWADQFEFVQVEISMSPDYDVVFDPDPAHQHSYGLKARLVTPDNFRIF